MEFICYFLVFILFEYSGITFAFNQASVYIQCSLKMLCYFGLFSPSFDNHLASLQSWKKYLLHIHDQKWVSDGLKVEIIISGGRADLNVKAKNHRAAELKHENWHEHRQLLGALYYCLIQQLFVGNLVVFYFCCCSKATVYV